ncbi:hypothetical protein FQZ97_889800 [compost metagenome]
MNTAHMTDEITSLQLLTRLQTFQCLMCHMPPKRHEWRAAFGAVFQLDQTAVPKRLVFDFNAYDGCREWRVKRSTCWHEQIHTEVMDAALSINEARFKSLIGIDSSLLAPGTNAKINVIPGTEVVPPLRGLCCALFSGCDCHKMGCVAIRDNRFGHGRRCGTHNWSKCLGIVRYPLADSACAIYGIKPASFAQNGCRKTRIHCIHLLQETPRWRFANGKIGIIVRLFATRGRNRNACHKPHGNKVE